MTTKELAQQLKEVYLYTDDFKITSNKMIPFDVFETFIENGGVEEITPDLVFDFIMFLDDHEYINAIPND